MDLDQSVTQWIQQVVQGEQGRAQEQLVERFLHRLTALARTRLQGVRGYEDEHDVALSAMNSFLVRAPHGTLGGVADRNALWSLLAAITIRKAISVRRRMHSQKRDSRRDKSLEDLVAGEPSRELLDSVCVEGNRLLESLSDPLLREVARLRMEGYHNEEIALRIDRSVKTVERKLQLVRKQLQRTLESIDG